MDRQDYDYWIGCASFGFALVISGLFIGFESQIEFLFSIIFVSCLLLMSLIIFRLIEIVKGGNNGFRRSNR